MKEIMKRVKSFILFDLPLETSHISARFSSTHFLYLQQFPNWCLAATRRKLIAAFWYQEVVLHLLGLVGLAVVGMFLTRNSISVVSLFTGGLLSLIPLVFACYLPAYYADFLPKLDTIISGIEKLNIACDEIKKCKRTQFSIPALTIIFYTFTKLGNIPLPPCNDISAGLLNNLYGADKDKLK